MESHLIMRQRLKQQEREKQNAEAAGQAQINDKTQTHAMQEHRQADGQQEQQQQEQEQSQIHDDWSKICQAILRLSDATLDDCVKRLNSSVFNKIFESYSIKDDISIDTFDNIMNQIDHDIKTQDIEKENENKKNEKSQYDAKEIRQFITEPVVLHLFNLI